MPEECLDSAWGGSTAEHVFYRIFQYVMFDSENAKSLPTRLPMFSVPILVRAESRERPAERESSV